MRATLTKTECLDYQHKVTLFAHLLTTWDADVIRRYIEQTRAQVDGALDALLPHFMSLQDIKKAQTNMRFLRDMGQHILAVRATVEAYAAKEAA